MDCVDLVFQFDLCEKALTNTFEDADYETLKNCQPCLSTILQRCDPGKKCTKFYTEKKFHTARDVQHSRK